jgi:hypothetical protein
MFYKLLEFFVADQDLEITETIIEIIKIENAIYIRVTKIKSHPFWSNNLMHITNREFNEKINANNYIMSLLYDISDDMDHLLKSNNIVKKDLPKSHLFSNIDINKFNIKKINYKNIMEESKKQLYYYMNNYTLHNI